MKPAKMEITLEIVNMETLCRVCLTDREPMYSLSSPLKASENVESATIKDVLETLMSEKVPLVENFPFNICKNCLENLKIAYKLREQFLNSNKVLRNLYGECKDKCAVEVIVGQNKYDLRDLVIVESVPEEKEDFNGFLENLGNSVSASFTTSKMKKEVSEKQNISFKKLDKYINKLVVTESDEDIDKDLNINVDDYITDLDKPLGEEKYIVSLAEEFNKETMFMDQDLLVSALNKRFECENCQKVYSNKTRFKNHLLTCLKLTKNSGGFPCTLCNKSFKDVKYLKFHIKDTHEALKKTCEICGVTFRSTKRYLYHKKYHHSNNSSICDFCGKNFINKSSLEEHRLRHKSGNDIVQCICPVCGKTFNYKGGLFYHMKTHNGERNYACSYCDRRFYSRVSIERHEKTHTGIRPYECKSCNKRFFSTSELRKHQFTHTGISAYRCQFCDKYFSSKFNLDIHLSFYRGDYFCDLCHRGFISKAILKFHKQRKHKNEQIVEKIAISRYEVGELEMEETNVFEIDYSDVEGEILPYTFTN